MSDLKQPIINLRKFVNLKPFIKLPESELRERAIVLKEQAHEALKKWDDKEAASKFWNDQFTGNYGD